MKKILLTGKADKRLIAYPMFYYADHTGKTRVITDDPNYRRLYEGYGTEGDIDNIHIEIKPLFSEDEDLSGYIQESEEAGYDTLIFILDAHREEKTFDKTIILAHQYMTFLGTEIEEVLDDTPNVSVTALSLAKTQTPQGIAEYNWTMDDFVYLAMTEETRKLTAPKNKKLTAFLKKCLMDSLPSLSSSAYDGLASKGGKK